MKLHEVVDLVDANDASHTLTKREIEEIANNVAMRFLRMSNGWDPTEDELFEAIKPNIIEACEKRAKDRADRYAFGM